MSANKRRPSGRRRVKKNVPVGQAHIKTSFNNTIVSLTDASGNVIAWESAGGAGFKGSRKSTPFAAQVTADAAAKAAEQIEMTVHQTRLTIRGDLKKLTAGMEAIAESNATQTGAAGFLSESGTRRKRKRTRIRTRTGTRKIK